VHESLNISLDTFPAWPAGKIQLLNWLSRFGSCCFLDNNSYAPGKTNVEVLAGAGVLDSFTLSNASDAGLLQAFLDKHKGKYIFGHLAYDLKEALHELPCPKPDTIGFAPLFFFVPEVCCLMQYDSLVIHCYHTGWKPANVLGQIIEMPPLKEKVQPVVHLVPRLDRSSYLEKIGQLREHILRGDCYEINYCQEFFAKGVTVDPLTLYKRLSEASPNPFSCYYRINHSYLLCASPERYITRKGIRLMSQPIKGTSARIKGDAGADDAAKKALYASTKDRSENVMVVDLVRNDLSRICKEGTVQVDELYGIYTYPQVHQMISTISGEQKDGVSFWEILQATFPMGSMTGAPKIRVMELIEKYELSRRGLFSGAVGYIAPNGDFDFNVVIRSLFYNEENRHLSYQVGGGITWYSNPEDEYDECMLKASAIKSILSGK
jgi:para-aminobenzoate synthetase component I